MILLLAAAGVKLAASLAAWLLVPCIAAASRYPLPPWYYLALALTFGGAGTALVAAGARGTPARYLGASFVCFGTLFADRLLFARLDCLAAGAVAPARVILSLQPIAFQAYVMWRFAWTFPNVQTGIVRPSLPRTMDLTTLAAGAILFAGNLAAALPGLPAPVYIALAWLGTDTAEGQFWLTLSLLILVSLVVLALKLRSAHADQRRRLSVVIIGQAVATFPMVLDVILTVIWPSFQAFFLADPVRLRARALVLTIFALVCPAAAAYAVVVEEVLDVRFIIRRAVRYSLARYSVFVVLAVPILALAFYVYARRDLPLTDLLAGGSVTMWVLLLVSVVVLLGARRPLLDAIDRQFFREEYDARQILSSLIEGARHPGTVDLPERICSEVDRALHLERAVLLLRDDLMDVFRDPQRRVREIDASTSLVHLVGGAATPLDVDLSPRSVVGRLSQQERQWLADTGARLLVPFLGSGGLLIAILVLGDKRSETPFTSEDRMLLMAVAASASFPLEAQIRDASDEGRRERSAGHTAAQCESCGSVQSRGDLADCPSCHGHLRPCMLPAVLAGKFAIDRQIGIGGMGVVYEAQDLDLGRPVALKTLPKIAPHHVARLRREARAMATIHHPHLAVIYAIEVWRGLPVLVIEYLAGGTLADRLRRGPLPADDVMALGVAIASVLDQVHRTGMLHRDVKPSNIGYTSDGVPKLLDFGLARLTAVTAGPGDITSLSIPKPDDVSRVEPSAETQGATQPLVGTASYLSPEAVSLTPPDHSLDLWALAVTLYEALSGRNPFSAPTVVETLQRISSVEIAPLRSVRAECPETLSDFLVHALSRDLRKRPGTAAEFLAGLHAVARSQAAIVRRTTGVDNVA
jgi:hypothetical protein